MFCTAALSYDQGSLFSNPLPLAFRPPLPTPQEQIAGIANLVLGTQGEPKEEHDNPADRWERKHLVRGN